MLRLLAAAALLCTIGARPAAAVAPALQPQLAGVLRSYLHERGAAEHITAASATVRLPDGREIDAASGATPSTLFQIGSNTKAFTAVLALELEAAGKLDIDDPIGRRLPEYPAWKQLTIRHLLDMTAGIPTYDNDQAFQRDYAARPQAFYSAQRLISYVYPRNGKAQFATGWHYSNTGYLLTQLILERASGMRFKDLLAQRIFVPLGLRAMYYDPHRLPAAVRARMAPGYFASDDDDNRGLQPIYGKDVRGYSLSWAQAAGGIVSTPSDLTRWARFLYAGAGLPPKQRAELTALVDTKTGSSIRAVSAERPHGFGLGVTQMFKPPLGVLWYYEGETLGYRVLHAWLPGSATIVTVALNSQPRAKEDRIGELMTRVVAVLPSHTVR